ncbi:two-partner secretion domain-containing protein [Moorena bouillonii]|uniref:two-partner secretion domain-containing protein n=1 Tax=Moorena bouillonii TaxID=207920 RepID=UPI0009D69DED|nr:filamentous hemagglutinin N-terminal domain-containing protein [Moorena bouillonii]
MGAAKQVITLTAGLARAIATALGELTLAMSGNYALADIVPDQTLGAEGSVVIPNTTVQGEIADKIEGGAKRGANLFHSFQKFNVGELQRVYFANPSGIENILSRVTGSNISNILGTLGVDGSANLFLLNPNGIVFGPQSRLDVAGSFFASTANSLVFGNGQEFSATSPEAPPLLTINITPGLQYGKYDPRTRIQNAGNLAVGQDLTLAAGNLDLQGQLEAGRDLTLFGEDTVSIRDSVAQPFIANSGGLLLIQGNQLINIAAHNHTDSGLLAGSDLRLRSHNPVAGDAHYTAGGSFSIEHLDGLPGNLLSPHDPIILANGDVSLGNYTGASLHILAGGSVTVGDLEINSTDTADNAISPNNSNPFLASLANVTLSDQAGTSVVIDGSSQPTLDIRAGIDWTLLGGFPGNTDTGNLGSNFGTAATSADITIGDISIQAPNGLVFLTNQYQPNGSNPSNTLEIGTLRTDDNFGGFVGNSGDVIIDYRGGIKISDRIDASSASGTAGDITLITNGQISLKSDKSFIISNTFGTEKAGDITIDTGSLFATGGAQIETSTFGKADAGKITIVADDTVTFDGFSPDEEKNFTERVTGPVNIIRSGAEGNSGGISITTGSFFVTGGAQMQVRLGDLRPNDNSVGNSGNIEIFARDQVIFGGIGSAQFGTAITSVEGGGIGDAGDIRIEARSVVLTNGSLQSNTLGKGDAGSVTIIATETVTLDKGPRSILSRVNPGGEGKGGDVSIKTGSLFLTNGAGIIADTQGEGNGGNITIDADQVIFDGIRSDDNPLNCDRVACPSGVFSSVSPIVIGKSGEMIKGGEIEINANSISLTNGGTIDAGTRGNGTGGSITLNTNELTVQDQGEISTSTFSEENGGSIVVNAKESVLLKNDGIISSTVNDTGSGDGGTITINTSSLSLINGGRIEARTVGFIPGLLVPELANQSYQEVVQDDQPVAYWRLDETNNVTAVDSSGNGFNGTYRNGVNQGVPGISGTAGEFDGNNDAVDVGIIAPGSELDISNKSFTVEAWVKQNESNQSNNQSYVGIHNADQGTNDQGNSLYFRVTPNGSVRFGDFPNDLETSGNIIKPDTWYHIVASYDQDSNTNSIFVDGRQVSTNNQGAFKGQNPRVLIGNWTLADPRLNQPFNGVIDEVAVYDEALSGESITRHFLRGQINLGGVSLESLPEPAANAGTITVNATDQITISGVSPTNSDIASGLVSSSSGDFSGEAGTITIDTDSLKVEDRGEINVSSNKGVAGNLDITANSLLLNNGTLFAKTQLSEGEERGNIILNISDLIQLKNESLISAQASEQATGGNITIDNNPFLIAFPPTDSNGSDIIANAPMGQGGNITINAFSIFGIEERKAIPGNRTNDIDASGATDSGEVNIQTENDFLEREPNSLPTDPGQAQFDQRCQPSNSTSSSFINTGRGGIPPRPGEISSNSNWEDIRRPTTRGRYRSRTALVKPPVKPPTTPKPKRIIEAQGIMIDADGNIFLTAYPTTVTPDGFRQVSGSCYLR